VASTEPQKAYQAKTIANKKALIKFNQGFFVAKKASLLYSP
jgi:hypothetical protein